MSQTIEMVGAIDDLLQKVAAQSDNDKKAEANTEAGGYQGSTTHPVKDVDDSTDDAQEGDRSAENTADVKEDQGSPSVDSTSEGTPGGQDSVQMDVGITSKATGEDTAVENDYKSTKDDGETSHPADTENSALDGHKYSTDIKALQQLCKTSEEIGSQLLAAIATETNGETQKAAQELAAAQQADARPEGNTATATGDAYTYTNQKQADEQAGHDLAGVFANTDIPTEDKVAADVMVVDTVNNILQLADVRAEKCAQFYAGQAEAARKQADYNGDGGEEDRSDFPEGSSDEEGDDAAAEGSPEDGGGVDEADILALLNGGEGMGADEAMGGMGPAEGGGDPLAEGGGDPLAGGGDPLDAGGGSPLTGGGDLLAGGGGEDPLAALAGGGGDPMAAAGGMPPGGDPMAAAGGMPPGDPAAAMGGDPMMGGDPAMGGDPMAGGGDAEALEAALAQLGITLEDLQMVMAQKAASTLHARLQQKVNGSKTAVAKPKTAAVEAMIGIVREIIGRGA